MCVQGPTDSCTGQDKSQAVGDTYFWAIFQITVGVSSHAVENKQVACYAKDQTCLVPCLRGIYFEIPKSNAQNGTPENMGYPLRALAS